jgi:hypothetical protein
MKFNDNLFFSTAVPVCSQTIWANRLTNWRIFISFLCKRAKNITSIPYSDSNRVLKLSRRQNSIKSSRADSRVKVWTFSIVSGSESIPETLKKSHSFTRLSARENVIVYPKVLKITSYSHQYRRQPRLFRRSMYKQCVPSSDAITIRFPIFTLYMI